jgi:hypothetical protein
VVCPVLASLLLFCGQFLLSFLGKISFICFVLPGFQSGYKAAAERKTQSKRYIYKIEIGCPAFLMLSVNFWAQVRPQFSSAKLVFKYQLQNAFFSANLHQSSLPTRLGMFPSNLPTFTGGSMYGFLFGLATAFLF